MISDENYTESSEPTMWIFVSLSSLTKTDLFFLLKSIYPSQTKPFFCIKHLRLVLQRGPLCSVSPGARTSLSL